MTTHALTAAAVGLAIALGSGPATAAEITVLVSNAFKTSFPELAPLFEKASEHRLKVAFGSTDPLKVRIEKGEAIDLAIIGEGAIDELIKQGKLVAATRIVVARSGLGVAVRKGAPKPDLSTTEAFKRTHRQREIDRLQRTRPDRHLPLGTVRQARAHRGGESEIQGRLGRDDGRPPAPPRSD